MTIQIMQSYLVICRAIAKWPPEVGWGCDYSLAGGSVKVTCVRKMADAAALYCVFYLY